MMTVPTTMRQSFVVIMMYHGFRNDILSLVSRFQLRCWDRKAAVSRFSHSALRQRQDYDYWPLRRTSALELD